MILTPSKMGDWANLLAIRDRSTWPLISSMRFHTVQTVLAYAMCQLAGYLYKVRLLIPRSVRMRRGVTVPRLRSADRCRSARVMQAFCRPPGWESSGPRAVNPQQVSCPNALLTVP